MPIKVNGYQNYFGGKSGNGTYQTIINHIPPCDVFMSLCLGNCGVARHMKPARINVLNDIDPDVYNNWLASDLPPNYRLYNKPVLEILSTIADYCDAADPANTLIFLDPPYRKEVRKSKADVYRFEMTDRDHTDILSQVTAMSDHYKFIICHYPDDVYDMYLHGWHTHDYYSTIRNGVALERLYYNFELKDQLHDYSYIGNDFRERETNNRIKKNMLLKFARLPEQLRNSVLIDLLEQYKQTPA